MDLTFYIVYVLATLELVVLLQFVSWVLSSPIVFLVVHVLQET